MSARSPGMFQAPKEEDSLMGAVLKSNREKLGNNANALQAVAGTFRTPVQKANGEEITPNTYADMVTGTSPQTDTPNGPSRS